MDEQEHSQPQGNPVPAKPRKGMGLHEPEEPLHHHKRNDGGDNCAEKDHGPVFMRSPGGMVELFEDLEAAGSQHGWNADQEGELGSGRAAQTHG